MFHMAFRELSRCQAGCRAGWPVARVTGWPELVTMGISMWLFVAYKLTAEARISAIVAFLFPSWYRVPNLFTLGNCSQVEAGTSVAGSKIMNLAFSRWKIGSAIFGLWFFFQKHNEGWGYSNGSSQCPYVSPAHSTK